MARRQEPNGYTNGNGKKNLGLYLSLAMSVFAVGKSTFFAGGETARQEEHLRYLDQRIDKEFPEFARRDVIDMRIISIERSQAKEEVILTEQTKLIEQINIELQRTRR